MVFLLVTVHIVYHNDRIYNEMNASKASKPTYTVTVTLWACQFSENNLSKIGPN